MSNYCLLPPFFHFTDLKMGKYAMRPNRANPQRPSCHKPSLRTFRPKTSQKTKQFILTKNHPLR